MTDDLRFDRQRAGDDDQDGGRLELQVTRSPPAAAPEPAAGPERFIVKVRQANYVPDGFDVRTRIDDLLFTAEASAGAVEAASEDPAIESISPARRLHRD